MKIDEILAVGLLLCFSTMNSAARDKRGGYQLRALPFTDITLDKNSFWGARIETLAKATAWHEIRFCEETERISNFAKAGGLLPGAHQGAFFNDSDVFKMIEGISNLIAITHDGTLEKKLDDIIRQVAAAQQPDGYLNTYFILSSPDKKLTNLRDMHELYCAGHLIEAGIAHNQATGKRTLLDVAIRYADFIENTFGKNKRHGVCGHPEIELALVKLYEVTRDEKYLDLAEFFIAERGREHGREKWGDYCQDHVPVEQQHEAVGHAVRAMYLYSAMTDLAAYIANTEYQTALDHLWEDVTLRKMYITGGVGARHGSESFGNAYELPNETAYAESCAAIGLVYWSHRMNLLYADARYADVMERALFNGVLAGISLDGTKFFYVNPLTSQGNHHRQEWFDCACCPPNILRLISSIGGYCYAYHDSQLFVNLYCSGKASLSLTQGILTLDQQTNYPWEGLINLTIHSENPMRFGLNLRIPGWCSSWNLKINSAPVQNIPLVKGYLKIDREWKAGDTVELTLDMPVARVYSHPEVRENRGRVALQRGPILYCIEGVDNEGRIFDTVIPPESTLSYEFKPDILSGIGIIKGAALRLPSEAWKERLYSTPGAVTHETHIMAVPYFAWDNREPGEMMVWIPESIAMIDSAYISGIKAHASHCNPSDSVSAPLVNPLPASSNDHSIPRMTWWDHKGAQEWMQYDFDKKQTFSSVEVYWFDDEAIGGGCRAPRSWRLVWKADDGTWLPVKAHEEYKTSPDRLHRLSFEPVETSSLRIEVVLQLDFSCGILKWKVN